MPITAYPSEASHQRCLHLPSGAPDMLRVHSFPSWPTASSRCSSSGDLCSHLPPRPPPALQFRPRRRPRSPGRHRQQCQSGSPNGQGAFLPVKTELPSDSNAPTGLVPAPPGPLTALPCARPPLATRMLPGPRPVATMTPTHPSDPGPNTAASSTPGLSNSRSASAPKAGWGPRRGPQTHASVLGAPALLAGVCRG